jgi:multiple sugar transport system substrate-binding protein
MFEISMGPGGRYGMKSRKILLVPIAALLAAGCTAESTGTNQMSDTASKIVKNEAPAPVTITISRPQGFVEEGFEQSIVQETGKLYPHITLNWITESPGNELANQVAAGTVADILFVNPPRIDTMKSLKLEFSLDNLIKQSGFDLGLLEPGGLDMVRGAFGSEQLHALPYALGFSALFYNKDLFDRFGVPYPQDSMTWEDAMDVAKIMTRSEGGIQYQGLGFTNTNILYSELSLPYANVSSGKSMLNTDGWNKAFAMLKSLYDVSGGDVKVFTNGRDSFSKNKTLAMVVTNNLISLFNQEIDLNWDLATLPSFKESPKTTAQPIGVSAAITATSKQKEEAFKVISVILSKPVQSVMIQTSIRPSVLKDAKLQEQFANLSGEKRKNLGAVFKHSPAKSVAATNYDAIVLQAANQSLNNVLLGTKDINSALREAEEQANQKIASERGGQ